MPKKIIPLLVAVTLLGLVIAHFEKPFQDRFTMVETPFYPNLKIDDIAAIDIDYFTHKTHLEKENQEWQVIEEGQKFLADVERVDRILHFFTEVKKGEPMTTDENKFPALQLDTTGISVTLFNAKGDKLSRMIIGKQGPDVFSTFVRDENDKKAYLVETYLTNMLNVPIEEWKKKE